MNNGNKAFHSWRKRLNMTQQRAAESLRLARITVANYDRGTRCGLEGEVIVPHVVLLACSAVENNLPPIK